uniref:Xylanolytic transcriptional activator regulatory domain-containing protein n=1 Tax=Mycena chlorophos TaxID=658473 RepID=A0ABQ0M2Z5_MYCCL|nr:predicted protein [Mycena chlorophos]
MQNLHAKHISRATSKITAPLETTSALHVQHSSQEAISSHDIAESAKIPLVPAACAPVFSAQNRKGKPCVFLTGPRKKNSRVAEIVDLEATSSSSPSPTEETTAAEPPSAEKPVGSALTLDTLAQELEEAASTVSIPVPELPAVDSHLSSHYHSDTFQPLFTDVFQLDLSPVVVVPNAVDDWFSMPFPPTDAIPVHKARHTYPWFKEIMAFPPMAGDEGKSHQQRVDEFVLRPLKLAEPRHYLYFFFSASGFLATEEFNHHCADKPPYLVKTMKACGALFVRTAKAAHYVKDSLNLAREGLAQAFAKSSFEPLEQFHLILAVVLLHTIGLFHQDVEERAASQSYHSMVIFMIRRTGLIVKSRDWKPDPNSKNPWEEWLLYETMKRALLLSYLHDCCQSIYFGVTSIYLPGEVSLRLPCDDRLWRAESAEEWKLALESLQTSHDPHTRHNILAGHPLNSTLSAMMQPGLDFLPVVNLSPFAHFVLIHGILAELFAACASVRHPAAFSDDDDEDRDGTSRTILNVQYAIHNWLQSYISSPAPLTPGPTEETSFAEHPLSFYWLAQIAILAHQERLPPFDSARNATGEVRFRIVKRWLKRIHTFLADGDQQSTVYWDELMKIKLQNWQYEFESDAGSDDDGLLGFFPGP